MWEKESQIIIANHLEKFEKLLSEIYKIFSIKFTDLSSFWNDLSIEENTHALMVATLKSMINDGSQYFNNRDYKLPDILKIIDKLKSYISDINEKNITVESAIKFAIFAEGSSLEKDIFKISEDDSEEIKRILNILHEDTKRHYNKIEKVMKELPLR
jgi:rubrerythrin